MTEEVQHASDIPDWCDETLPCGQLLEAKQENQELRSEIARLRQTGDRLAMFSTHDIDCDCHVGHKVSPCNCGYTVAINAWKELQP